MDYLKIARVDASGLGGIVFWNGNDEVENGVLGNMTGSVVLRTSSGSSSYPWGVVVGAQNKTYTSNSTTNHNGYYIGVVASSDGAGRLGNTSPFLSRSYNYGYP